VTAAIFGGPFTVVQAEYAVAAIVGLAAVVEDLARRTISNWLSLAALAAGLGCQLAANGWMGLAWGALGAVSGFAVFLVFYLLGGMGGGDVKLMAGFGAMLGAGRLLSAAYFTALMGGIFAALVLLFSFVRVWWRRRGGATGEKVALTIPYAPAIASGVLLALLAQP
jgi:prepilin peptidase CpaA